MTFPLIAVEDSVPDVEFDKGHIVLVTERCCKEVVEKVFIGLGTYQIDGYTNFPNRTTEDVDTPIIVESKS